MMPLDRPQLAAARQRAAQRLERDPAAPALHQPGAERLAGIVPGRADRKRKGRRQHRACRDRFRPRRFFRRRASTPGARAAASRRSRCRDRRRSACCRPARRATDRLMFCASVSDGLRSSSGARLALRTVRLTLALGSGAHGSAVPCASASSPVPDIFAFSRSGARHTPRHRSFELRRAFAGRDHAIEPEQRQQATALLRRQFRSRCRSRCAPSASRSMPWTAATAGFAVIVATPLSCGASRSSTARALARSACPAFLSRSSASLRRAGPGLGAHRIEPRSAAPARTARSAPVSWPSDAALEFSASFPVALTRSKLPRAFQRHAARAGRSSTARARSSSDRSRASPPTAAIPGRPRSRGRCRARAAPRPAIRPAVPPANATNAAAASRSRRSAFSSASTREPPLACRCETATRPFDGAAVDLGLHGVDRKAVRRHGDVAAQPQRLLAAIGDLAAALQPGHQRIRIGGIRR